MLGLDTLADQILKVFFYKTRGAAQIVIGFFWQMIRVDFSQIYSAREITAVAFLVFIIKREASDMLMLCLKCPESVFKCV